MDMSSELLGTVKPYRRVVRIATYLHSLPPFDARGKVIISTGKSDWGKDVTEVEGSLAAHLFSAQTHLGTSYSPPLPRGDVSGLIRTGDNVRIPIFNGSHSTISEEEALHTVLLFPDFKAIIDVASTSEGGENLWRSYVDPAVGRIGALLEGSGQKSYVLPYFCVIHICTLATFSLRQNSRG